jgi:hypothetical protein
VLVLDSGGVTRLAERSQQTVALILALRDEDLWPPFVPSVVLVECLHGEALAQYTHGVIVERI